MRNLLIVVAFLLAFSPACSSSTVGTSSEAVDATDTRADPDVGASDTADVDSDDGGSDTSATDADAADTTPDTLDADDVGEDACTCAMQGPCCDGCQAVNVGQTCDDGLSCTLGTTCQPDGTCADATGSPCDDRLEEPQCQSVSCDETSGCGRVENVREGFECDDGDPQTYGDECQGGACVGTPCECDTQGQCCDGCHLTNTGQACDDGDPETQNDTCTEAGECRGCECSDASNPCCDGCSFEPAGTKCGETSEGFSGGCPDHKGYCGGTFVERERYRSCSGQSPACDGPLKWFEVHREQCQAGYKCTITGCEYAQSCS